jgi:thioredoxin-like negative regulator of GroEL
MSRTLDRFDGEAQSIEGDSAVTGSTGADPADAGPANADLANAALANAGSPRLLFFYSETSGPCRRTAAHLAQILQRRRNHHTFEVVRIRASDRPKAVELLGITILPTLIVVEDGAVRARVEGPHGRPEIEETLRPWLRTSARSGDRVEAHRAA